MVVVSSEDLQDNVPATPLTAHYSLLTTHHSGERAKAIVAAELGKPIEQCFDSFETEPIAAASLGQVQPHAHRTHTTRTPHAHRTHTARTPHAHRTATHRTATHARRTHAVRTLVLAFLPLAFSPLAFSPLTPYTTDPLHY